MVSAPDTKTKALCVATRCATVEQFVTTFHRFCDETSFFVATLNTRPVGLETPFAIQLADRAPVLRGLCVVLEAWTTPANAYKRPGIRLGIRRLTPDSEAVFAMLQQRRAHSVEEVRPEDSEPVSETPVPVGLPQIPSTGAKAPPLPKRAPTAPVRTISVPIKVPTVEAPAIAKVAAPAPPPAQSPTPPAPAPAAVPVAIDAHADATTETATVPERTPGSELVLPANPLHSLTDESLEGFVDCTIYEETANFFRAPEAMLGADDSGPIAPPAPAAPADEPPVFKPLVVAGEATPEPPPIVASPRAPTEGPRLLIDVSRVDEKAVVAIAPARPTPVPAPAPIAAAAPAPEPAAPVPVPVPVLPPPMPSEVARATPVPAGERLVAVAEPARASSRLWWIAGGAAVAAAAAVLLIVRAGASEPATPVAATPGPIATPQPEPEGGERGELGEPEPPPAPLPEVAPPPTEVPPGDDPADADDDPPPAATDAPLVGSGPCRLDVTTTPAGTLVRLDGQTIGPSPIAIAGPCSKRRVELVHPRYKAETRVVTLAADAPATLDVTLVRPTHALHVITTPPGATISIGGRRAGTSPAVVQLMGFSGLDVKIEKWGFEPVTKRIYSKKAKDKLVVKLKRSLFPR